MRARRGPFVLASLLVLGVAAAVTIAGRAAVPPVPPPVPEVDLGDRFGAGTYALPGGAWIFDVPEGMRLWHSLGGGTPSAERGVNYGFKDVVTGSLLTLYVLPGGSEVDFYGINKGQTPAARELAAAWLDAVEASVRRPPGYVESGERRSVPASRVSGAWPGTNPEGFPYLCSFRSCLAVFEGGRTYAIPGDDFRPEEIWLVTVPAGMRVIFEQNNFFASSSGRGYYLFEDHETGEFILVDQVTGQATSDTSALLYELASSFRRRTGFR